MLLSFFFFFFFCFFFFFAFHDALVTREHMYCWRYTGDSLCIFCHAKQENRDHLFFECGLNRRIWRILMAECGVVDPGDLGCSCSME
jgi:hypothetical protein